MEYFTQFLILSQYWYTFIVQCKSFYSPVNISVAKTHTNQSFAQNFNIRTIKKIILNRKLLLLRKKGSVKGDFKLDSQEADPEKISLSEASNFTGFKQGTVVKYSYTKYLQPEITRCRHTIVSLKTPQKNESKMTKRFTFIYRS